MLLGSAARYSGFTLRSVCMHHAHAHLSKQVETIEAKSGCAAACCALQSSHKLQVVVVCEEALPRITYSARTVDVGPLSATLAADMVRESQPGATEVRSAAGIGRLIDAPAAAFMCHVHQEMLLATCSNVQQTAEHEIADAGHSPKPTLWSI